MSKLKLFTILGGCLLLAVIISIPILMAGEVGQYIVDQGIVTDIEEIKGRYAITFDGERVNLLHRGYPLEEPDTVILGEHYVLYKEDASACFNGYHLVKGWAGYMEEYEIGGTND